MNKTKEQRNVPLRMIRPLLFGVVIGALTTVVLLMFAALLLSAVSLPKAVIMPVALATVALGSLVGGFGTARVSRERGLLFGAACGLLLFLIIAVAGVLAMPSASGVTTFVKLALAVGFGALGGILGVNVGRK